MALEGMSDEDQTSFNRDAIAVMISCETDIKQIHQDFADCSKTKQLPPSMVALYDTRNPANRLVVDLAERCPLFRDRIDSTSKSLSKKSTFLFLTNQIRQLVKELLKGSYALPDVQFERLAVELLGTDEQYRAAFHEFSEYINYLTEAIPVWKEIAAVKPGTLEASYIPQKREEGWVCLTATGLNLIGRIGYKLTSDKDKRSDWKHYADKLGQIDWRRSAEMWVGNIILENRLMTQQVPLRNAFEKVCGVIGL
jgi:DGQHR domain-containing protein